MRRTRAGFTMVEVLVAVLLLAVGLVGALAMQAHAMRARQESALQTEALQAAATLADRIRANAGQSSSYLGFEFDATDAQDAAAPASACSDAPCDAVALAQRELEEFRLQLAANLPSGRATVCRDDGASVGGALQWACSQSVDAPITIKIGWRGADAAPQLALRVALGPPSLSEGAP
ncbi:type IV pilus modification protein PilV [Pseudoduganella sp. DS3]|uniref:Type IV pilus modification protein PilV n=1 Tax=Pseudoduganella guangdongensis TaxID=2692179 RepID=A0A6N9HQJ3_9BURK|nr:type IV pilus modification protein PilV [Pseudoduganella guangdongensis]MYN05553.1 type IV pilus modification protein PilV [Pseudoduganella guangdongensis]